MEAAAALGDAAALRPAHNSADAEVPAAAARILVQAFKAARFDADAGKHRPLELLDLAEHQVQHYTCAQKLQTCTLHCCTAVHGCMTISPVLAMASVRVQMLDQVTGQPMARLQPISWPGQICLVLDKRHAPTLAKPVRLRAQSLCCTSQSADSSCSLSRRLCWRLWQRWPALAAQRACHLPLSWT